MSDIDATAAAATSAAAAPEVKPDIDLDTEAAPATGEPTNTEEEVRKNQSCDLCLSGRRR